MRVLVSGGAGYIGSHTVLSLIEAGHDVVVVDNFSNSKPTVQGRLEALSGVHVPFHAFDLTRADKTVQLFEHEQIDAVVHFAGFKAVAQSVEKPLEYYRNNLDATFSLIDAMRATGTQKFVFSSSATVYGPDAPVPYVEDYKYLAGTAPYGNTKVWIEQILRDVAAVQDDWKVALLRYFNPVGAHPSGQIGEDPQGIPDNLMPFIAQVAVGRRERLMIFGDDYPTADGTCERDYIHVMDLAEAHVAALEHLGEMAEPTRAFNVGTGKGTSVLEMLRAFERAIGHKLPYTVGPRRAGDLAAFWADPSRAHTELDWTAQRTIDQMCTDTWRWQSANPQGYLGA